MFVAVDVNGTTKSEESIIRHCIDDCVKVAFPDSTEIIEITVNVVDQDELSSPQTYAEVDEEYSNDYTILLSKQALEDDVTLYKTIAHECIHIKQYFTKELVHVNQYRSMFKNKVYDHFCTPYEKRPWEVEAFYLEEELYKCSDLRA